VVSCDPNKMCNEEEGRDLEINFGLLGVCMGRGVIVLPEHWKENF